MMKKLLLLALLAPLTMQDSVKAHALAETVMKIVKPWSEDAMKPWRYSMDPITKTETGKDLKYINFNLKLDLVTFAIAFAGFFYSAGLEAPWREGQVKSIFKKGTHTFIEDWLPRILAGHEVYKRGALVAWGKPQDPLGFVVSLTKIALCFEKIASRAMKLGLNKRLNIEIPRP